jgi:quinolinate synthase
MQTATISFDRFNACADNDCHERIRAARAKLGNKAVLLCHHYQRADVYQHADLTGDSLKLSRLASQTDAEYIVFCGVHFMAEVADIMSARPEAILPDLAAGCSMADMANLAKVERCWRELAEVLDPDEKITPVTYINSAADLKAFCGEHGGIVCTSSNAGTIARLGLRPAREKVLFFPDQHLGRWTGHSTWAFPLDEMVVWDPDLELRRPHPGADQEGEASCCGRATARCTRCSSRRTSTQASATKYPDGLVIAHPECNASRCAAVRLRRLDRIHRQDHQGSAGRHALAGRHRTQPGRPPGRGSEAAGKIVQFMATTICMCSTMQRIDPQHLAWTLENLAEGKVVNQIKVPEHEADAGQAGARPDAGLYPRRLVR